jgi:hypothetical protein
MRELPHVPRNDALLRARFVREHRDVLQQVTIAVVEEDRRGRHPGKNHRLVCWLAVEIQRGDARRTQCGRGCDDVCEADAKRNM